MNISGRELIARLQWLIAKQARLEEAEVGRAMVTLVTPELQKHGAESHAEEVFDLFRRARREALSMRSRRDESEANAPGGTPGSGRTLQTISMEMMNWGNFNPESITRFYVAFREAFEELLRSFNKSRSRRSHLTAIFRPFSDRYVDAWDRYLDNYPTSEIRLEASRLLDQVVTKENLDDWGNRVFSLFVRSAVYSPDMNRKQREDVGEINRIPIQLGLIKLNSVEIYRGRWNELFALNRKEIESGLSGAELEPWRHLQSHSSNGNFASTIGGSEGFSQHAIIQDRSNVLSGVSVVLSLTENQSINAQRSWASQDLASSDIIGWLDMLKTLWASAGNSVTAKVMFSSSTGDSEVTVPPLTFSAASELLPQLINSYK
jgi:hypothetical protein